MPLDPWITLGSGSGGFLELLTWGLEPGSAADPLELEQLFQRMAGPVLNQLKRP